MDEVGQAKILSKLDLIKGFYQVHLAPKAKDLTTFLSPFGKYRFKSMPFGLKNAPAVFQALMEKGLASCKGFTRLYIDDVLVYSNSWKEHMNHYTKVSSALCAAGLISTKNLIILYFMNKLQMFPANIYHMMAKKFMNLTNNVFFHSKLQ